MASGLDQNRITDWLNATVGESAGAGAPHLGSLSASFAASTSNLGHIRLMTANGSSTSNGTQLNGGSYVQGTGVQYGTGSGGFFSAATYGTGSGSTSNGSAVSQTGMPAATIAGIEIWDSAGTAPAYAASNRWWWGALSSSITTNNGDTLTFSIGSITVTLNG